MRSDNMKKTISLDEVLKGRARKYNNYQESNTIDETHSCATCRRRTYSPPWACNDGWPCGSSRWTDRGSSCSNWTDNPAAEVD